MLLRLTDMAGRIMAEQEKVHQMNHAFYFFSFWGYFYCAGVLCCEKTSLRS